MSKYSYWLVAFIALTLPLSAFAKSTPAVHSISPSSGTSHLIVEIHGKNFPEELEIFFGETPVKWMYRKSSTIVYAYVPNPTAIGTVHVTIRTPQGTSARHSKDKFTYTQ